MRGCLVEINLQDDAKQMNGKEMHNHQNMPFSSNEYTEKLQKENTTLLKALAHRNKLVELSGIEIQKLRINLRNVQEKNLQLAQKNSQMLMELNTNRDRLKALQHELCCMNVLLKTRKMQFEEQTLPCTDHASRDKVPANASDGDDMNHKDTKRKQTPKKKPLGSSNVKPIHVNEKANSKRRVSGVIDTTIIPEETSQLEDDIEKDVVSRVENQIVENVIDKKFVLDVANPVQDSEHSKRLRARRQSTRFDFQETEQTEKLLEMDDDAKETKETTSLTSRRRSAWLKPEEAEPCKSFDEREVVKEPIKRRRVSSRRESAMFDIQEPEVTETFNADDARSLVEEESIGSRAEVVKEPSELDTKETDAKRRVSMRKQSTKSKSQTTTETNYAIKETATDPSLHHNLVQEDCEREPSESRDDTKETNANRRVSTRRQSTKGKSQTATEKTDEAIKETATDLSLRNNIVQDYDLMPSKVSQDCDSEQPVGSRSDAVEPSESRHDTKEANGKRRVSTKRQLTKGKSQTATEKTDEAAIKEIATDPSSHNNIVQECDLIPSTVSQVDQEREPSESKHDTKAKRRVSRRRQSPKVKSRTTTEKTNEAAIKETATDPSLRNNIVQEYNLIPSTVSQEDCEREPSKSRHDTTETNGKRSVSTRRQSNKGKSQTATEKTDESTIKEIASDPSLRNKKVKECDLIQSRVSQEDHEGESKKKKPRIDEEAETEAEGMVRTTSVGRPSRHAAEKVQSYREVSLKVKMRRNN